MLHSNMRETFTHFVQEIYVLNIADFQVTVPFQTCFHRKNLNAQKPVHARKAGMMHWLTRERAWCAKEGRGYLMLMPGLLWRWRGQLCKLRLLLLHGRGCVRRLLRLNLLRRWRRQRLERYVLGEVLLLRWRLSQHLRLLELRRLLLHWRRRRRGGRLRLL